MTKLGERATEVPIEERRPGAAAQSRTDQLAVEEPLEIRLVFGPKETRESRSLAITMRTPGDDLALAAGFLLGEGVVRDPREIEQLEHCGPVVEGRTTSNIVKVELAPNVTLDLPSLERNFYTTSSCGICGKASLDAVELSGIKPLPATDWKLSEEALYALAPQLGEQQQIFAATGGLHAAGWFDHRGRILSVHEDVGRHNAMDKLIGLQFRSGRLPLNNSGILLSGRASFELAQKALMAGVPMVVAVGAPSSLAVEVAQRFGMTLVGFVSAERFNVYAGAERIA